MSKIAEAARIIIEEQLLASEVGGKITLEQIVLLHGLDLKAVLAADDLIRPNMRKGRRK